MIDGIRKLTKKDINKLAGVISLTNICPMDIHITNPSCTSDISCNDCWERALQYLRIVDDKDAYNDSSE